MIIDKRLFEMLKAMPFIEPEKDKIALVWEDRIFNLYGQVILEQNSDVAFAAFGILKDGEPHITKSSVGPFQQIYNDWCVFNAELQSKIDTLTDEEITDLFYGA